MLLFLLFLQQPVPDGLSNSVEVQIEDDEEPYEMARAVDSDDDRYVGTAPLTEEEMELLRRLCPDRDPLVPEFSDLRH